MLHRRLPILTALLAALGPWLPARGAAVPRVQESAATLPAQDEVADPEATARGRSTYYGREVARTMHWTGAAWLLRETRENEENGQRLREWLDPKPGQAVCDLGCGNGYHTLPLAEAVGPQGRVYAVDLQPEMLELLSDRAREAKLRNIEYVRATVDDPKVPLGSCDLVLMIDVYHELSHPESVLRRVRAALRPGGRLVVVEFRAEDPAVPIKPVHKMTKAQIVNELAPNGFGLVGEYDGLPWQHVLAFSPDPGYPREDPLRFAGRQVALGLQRDLLEGDVRSLAGYYADELAVLPSSELLDPVWGGGAGDRENGARLARGEWLERLKKLRAERGPGGWRELFELGFFGDPSLIALGPPGAELWDGALAGDLALRLEAVSGPDFVYVLRADEHGRWLVVAERSDY